jgi:hypothetical protein
MFAGKAREYPSEASFRCTTQGLAPDFTHKQKARLEGFARDKHSSLLPIIFSITDVKSFIALALCFNFIKLFFFIVTDVLDK